MASPEKQGPRCKFLACLLTLEDSQVGYCFNCQVNNTVKHRAMVLQELNCDFKMSELIAAHDCVLQGSSHK